MKTLVIMGDAESTAASRSPAIQEEAINGFRDDLQDDYEYLRYPVEEGDLDKALPVMHRAEIAGLSVTTPHKIAALETNRVTSRSQDVELIGATNTLLWRPEGYHAENTDWFGASMAIEAALDDANEPKPLAAVIFGAGGAAAATALGLMRMGIGSVSIVNRTAGKAVDLAERFNAVREELRTTSKGHTIPAQVTEFTGSGFIEAEGIVNTAALLINTTTVGRVDQEEEIIPSEWVTDEHIVFETIYHHQTALARAAEAVGALQVSGRLMLAMQGARQFRLFTGLDLDADKEIALGHRMDRVLEREPINKQPAQP